MRNPWVVAGAFVLSAALVWIVLSWNTTDSVESEVTAPSDPLAAAPPPAPAPFPTAQPSAPSEPLEPAAPAPSAESPATAAPAEPDESQTAPPVPPRTGPVDEFEQLFSSEPRASNARSLETVIEGTFRRPEVPPGLLKSVICRTTVCRVETRWSPDRAQGFLSAAMHLVAGTDGQPSAFDHDVAIDPDERASSDGTRDINIFVKRAPAADENTQAPTATP